MISSNSPKRSKFIPTFPAKSNHLIKRHYYKPSSILEAIDHYKKQLIKLEHKPKNSSFVLNQPQISKKTSINCISLTLPLSQQSPNKSQQSLLSNLPTKKNLPPLKILKKIDSKVSNSLICTSRQPIFVKIHRNTDKKSMNASKSHKEQEKVVEIKNCKKSIVINKVNSWQRSSESSDSSLADQSLIEDIKLKYFG